MQFESEQARDPSDPRWYRRRSTASFSAWVLWARQSPPTSASGARRPNLSAAARRYVDRLNPSVEDLFHHVLATLHDPAYREANAGALRMEWPRIPLPYWSDLSAPAGQGAVPGRGASRSAHSPGDEGAGGRERATTRVAPTVGDAVRESRSSAQAEQPPTAWPPRPRAAANWPRCWTPTPRRPA